MVHSSWNEIPYSGADHESYFTASPFPPARLLQQSTIQQGQALYPYTRQALGVTPVIWSETPHRREPHTLRFEAAAAGCAMGGGGTATPDAATSISPAPLVVAAPVGIRENRYVFKSRLHDYTQKAGLPTPKYHTLKKGPSHEPFFKSTVVVGRTKYDSLRGFSTRKAAEQSAAEVALMKIFKPVLTAENKNTPAVPETGLCKNLLQEFAQKMKYAIPSYICTKQASGGTPFICTVEIGGKQYTGAAARTKKVAEIKAARAALLAIGQSEGCANGATNSGRA